jgi:hypothetical protein
LRFTGENPKITNVGLDVKRAWRATFSQSHHGICPSAMIVSKIVFPLHKTITKV